MRAEFFPDLSNIKIGSLVSLHDKDCHHLINVARIKIEEPLVLFDGKGGLAKGVIKKINHKLIEIEIQFKEVKKRNHKIDLAVGLCKREAMETVLKAAVELGVNRLIPLKTEFSQKKFIREDRVEKIVISSLKQSNSYFLPSVDKISFLEGLDFSSYDNIFCMSLKKDSSRPCSYQKGASSLILVGPEGGLSEREEDRLLQRNKSTSFIHLPCYILRTPTAVSAAMGWAFALALKSGEFA